LHRDSPEKDKKLLELQRTLIREGWGSDPDAYREFFTSQFIPDVWLRVRAVGEARQAKGRRIDHGRRPYHHPRNQSAGTRSDAETVTGKSGPHRPRV
jgi:hypothetical protein